MDGISKTFVDDINIYIDDIDTAIAQTTDTYMCRDECPCVEVDETLWDDTSMRNQLRNDDNFNFEGEFETFVECYKAQ